MKEAKQYIHTPILVDEILNYFSIKPDNIIVDCTTGEGGHSVVFAPYLDENGMLICLDRDQEILNIASQRLSAFRKNIITKEANYANLSLVLDELNIARVDLILCDLGISMFHFKEAKRGFSFMDKETLDMRLDREGSITAYDIVNSFKEYDIRKLLFQYGEESRAKLIARNIVKARKIMPIKTADDLQKVICSGLPKRKTTDKLHPATKTFQALRIYVNNELDHIKDGLIQGIRRLNVGGKIAVISFHSLEDRIVKQVFKHFSRRCICPADYPICQCGGNSTLKLLTKKPVTPTNNEINVNPAARSAKLRVVEKIYEASEKLWENSKQAISA